MIVTFLETAFAIIQIALAMNEWNVVKKRGMHFIHININSLLPKIDEVSYIAKITNASIIENAMASPTVRRFFAR